MSLKTDSDLSNSYWNSHASNDHPYKFSVEEEAMLLPSGLISPISTHYLVSQLGKDLFKYGIIDLYS